MIKEHLRVELISRKPGRFNSIEKVFSVLAPHLGDHEHLKSRQLKFGSGIFGILLNLFFFRTRKADVHHVTGESHFLCLKLPSKSTILTIHDLRFLERRSGLRGYLIRKLFLDWPLEKTRWITAISNATKEHIEKEFPDSAGKIRVIPNPITIVPADPEEIDRGPRDTRRVLQVGTEPHKNLSNVIEALRGTDIELVVLGRLSDEDCHALNDSGITFRNHEFLEESDLRKAYLDSDVLVFCSFFEGFGLPIIEAQSLGVPVITSDIPVLRETAGEGALFADPSDSEDIRKKILIALGDESVRGELISQGLENVNRFLPERIGEMYRQLYAEVRGTQRGDR